MNWDKIHVHTFSLFLLGVAATSLSLTPIYIKQLLPLCRYLSSMRTSFGWHMLKEFIAVGKVSSVGIHMKEL